MRKSFLGKIVVSAEAIFILFALLVACIAYFTTYSIVIRDTTSAVRQEVALLHYNVDDILKEAEARIGLLANDRKLIQRIDTLMEGEQHSDVSTAISQIGNLFKAELSSRSLFSSLFLITEETLIGISGSELSIVLSRDGSPPVRRPGFIKQDLADIINANRNSHVRLISESMVYAPITDAHYLVGVVNFSQIVGDKGFDLLLLNSSNETVFASQAFPAADPEALVAQIPIGLDSASVKLNGEEYISISFISRDGLLRYLALANLEPLKSMLRHILYRVSAVVMLIFVCYSVLISMMALRMVDPLRQFASILHRTDDFQNAGLINRFISRFRHSQSIRTQFFWFYSLSVVPLSLIIVTNLLFFKPFITQSAEDNYNRIVRQLSESMVYKMQTYESTIKEMAFNSDIQQFLIRLASGQSPDEFRAFMPSFIMNKGFLSRGAQYFNVYAPDGRSIYSSHAPEEASSLPFVSRTAFDPNRNELWVASGGRNPEISLFWRVLLIPNSGIRHSLKDFAVLGYIEIGTGYLFDSLLGSSQATLESTLYVADKHNNIVYAIDNVHMDNRLRETDASDNGTGNRSLAHDGLEERVLVSRYDLSKSGWTLHSSISTSSLARDTQLLYLYHILILLLIIPFLLIVANGVTVRMIRPIVKLQQYMDNWHLSSNQPLHLGSHSNEFVRLAGDFKRMLTRLEQMVADNQRKEQEKALLEKRKKEEQYIALQTQINPHFLSNIFSSIHLLIESGQLSKAGQMVKGTGELFASGLYQGRSIVHVSEEIEHVMAYTALQQIHLKDRIEVIWSVDASTREKPVLKFMLQPLVENAVEHGLTRNARLIVRIRIEQDQDGGIGIEVRDNGKGMSPERLAEVRQMLSHERISRHVGLSNVNARIKLHFGDAYGVELESGKGEGTTVRLRFPPQP